ncbi:MAG TPA: hypothetical protein VJ937_12760, partial [Salinivirga sp.]|uniref:hypothetical protein n=1 Tax=Salinivirga sp. TaxID=1970192 RepID=UPI002B496B25
MRYNGEISAGNLAPSETDKLHMYALNADGEAYSPAWHTLNFRIMYKLNQRIELSGAVENITDRQYRPYSSGIVAPGRNFIISARYRF